MRHFSTFLFIFSLLLVSCEGDQGPPGPPGFDGQDGGLIVAESFERTVDFTPSNNYEVTLEVPSNIEIFESDMVLVYRLVGQIDGFDSWRMLPETVYIETGEEFQYNFEHNFDFIFVYIDAPATFDFNTLLDEERLNQTFRVVILPVDFVNSNNIDVTNYNEVLPFIESN